MTLERLTQITSVGISSGITLSSATLTGVTTLTTLSAGGDIDAVNGTFSGNLNVTGGSVGIGTDNPQEDLHIGGNSPYILLDDYDNFRKWRLKGTAWFAIEDTTAGEDRLRILSNGNVGIGTDNPQTKLSVSSGGPAFEVYPGLSNSITLTAFDRNVSDWYDMRLRAENILFSPQGSEKVRITSSGNVGIGLTNPGALLSIPAGESNTPRFAIESAVDNNDFTITQYEDGNGTYTMLGQNVKLNSSGNNTVLDSGHRTAGILLDARNHGAITFLTGDTNTATENVKIDANSTMYVGTGANPGSARVAIANNFINGNGLGIQNTGPQGGGQYFAIFYNSSNAISGSISHNGSATVAFNTSSDYRLKENVVSLTGAADRVNQIQVHRFNFIADPDKTVDGFLAHEVQSVVPECVTGEKDAVDDEGNPVYQGIDQSKLVPLLTAALQEAFAKIETLETRLTALEGQ